MRRDYPCAGPEGGTITTQSPSGLLVRYFLGLRNRHVPDPRDDLLDRQALRLRGLRGPARHLELLRELPLGRVAVALPGAARLRPARLGAPAREPERDHVRKLGVLVRARRERLGREHPVGRARAAVRVERVRLVVLRRRRRRR